MIGVDGKVTNAHGHVDKWAFLQLQGVDLTAFPHQQ